MNAKEKEILMNYVSCVINEGFLFTLEDRNELISIGICRNDFKKEHIEIIWDNTNE